MNMILSKNLSIQPQVYPAERPFSILQAECSRVLHAAVVNRRFQQRLLSDPVRSIEEGYCGETFHFTREEKEQLRSIRATSLEEFASTLMHTLNTTRVPELVPVPR
jgi:hypothetical protein